MGHFLGFKVLRIRRRSIKEREQILPLLFLVKRLTTTSTFNMPKAGCGKKMSEENQAKYLEAFDAFDADGEGSISKSELANLLPDISGDAITSALDKFDANDDGQMSKDEFLDFVYVSTLEDARNLLKAADASGDGKITKEELVDAFAKMNLPSELAEEAMSKADDDGSGTLSVDEIVDFLLEV